MEFKRESVLGSILLQLYINDFHSIFSSKIQIYLFVYDAKIMLYHIWD